MSKLYNYQNTTRQIMLKERVKELVQERFWVQLRQQKIKETPWWMLTKYFEMIWLWYGEREINRLIAQYRKQITQLNNTTKWKSNK